MRYQHFLNLAHQDPDINIKTLSIYQAGKEPFRHAVAPYDLEVLQLMFSMTKSITALAIGIACDQGLLTLNDKVVTFFPDKLPQQCSENLRAMKIRDLLTMTSGTHDDNYLELFDQSDWGRAFLSQEFCHVPGSYYRYNTHGSHMLSLIIEIVSKQSLEAYVEQHLFRPLSIKVYNWEKTRENHTAGGMGLSLKIMDIEKIGRLILNDGWFDGQQVVSDAFLREATTTQVFKHSETERSDRDYCGQYYGFQFHVDSYGNPRMDGAFGQLCLILKDIETVITITSAGSKMDSLLALIYNELLRGGPDTNEPQLTSIKNPMPKWLKDDLNKTYAFERLELSLHIEATGITLQYVYAKRPYRLYCPYDKIGYGESVWRMDLTHGLQTYSVEMTYAQESVLITQRYLNTPTVTKYIFSKTSEGCSLSYTIINTFEPVDIKCLGYEVTNRNERVGRCEK